MLSLTELLTAINKFHILATKKFPLVKRAAMATPTPVYEKVTEDIFDNLVNNDFATQFEKYLGKYEELMNSLDISPQQFNVIIHGGDASGDSNFIDYLDQFNKYHDRLVESPYLQQDLESEGWEEGVSPLEVIAGIEDLARDANNKMYALGKANGLSRNDVDELLANIVDATVRMLQGKGEEGVEEGMTAQQQKARSEKLDKFRQYSKNYRDRLAISRAAGQEGLQAQIGDLENKFQTEQDVARRDEIERLLRDKKKRLETVINFQKRQAAQQQKLMENPEAYDAYVANMAARKQNSRKFNNIFFKLIDQLDATQNPSDKQRIKAQIVRAKKELLLKNYRNLNFDDPHTKIRKSPKVWTSLADELDPDKIIAAYRQRRGEVVTHLKNQNVVRRTRRTSADLYGMISPFQISFATFKNEVKKALNRNAKKAPELKPYFDALLAATKTGNPAAIQQAKTACEDAIDNWVLNHQFTKRAAGACQQLSQWRDELLQVESFLKNKSQEEAPALSDQIKQMIADIVQQGQALAEAFAPYGNSIGGVIQWIGKINELLQEWL